MISNLFQNHVGLIVEVGLGLNKSIGRHAHLFTGQARDTNHTGNMEAAGGG